MGGDWEVSSPTPSGKLNSLPSTTLGPRLTAAAGLVAVPTYSGSPKTFTGFWKRVVGKLGGVCAAPIPWAAERIVRSSAKRRKVNTFPKVASRFADSASPLTPPGTLLRGPAESAKLFETLLDALFRTPGGGEIPLAAGQRGREAFHA